MSFRTRYKKWKEKRRIKREAADRKPSTLKRAAKVAGLTVAAGAASTLGSVALLRSGLGKQYKKPPFHLRPDIKRAKKLGLKAVAHRGTEHAAFALPMTKTARVGTNSTKRSRTANWVRDKMGMPRSSKRTNVSVLRHEIGHLEELKSKQDQRRIKQAKDRQKNGFPLRRPIRRAIAGRLQNEFQAWKNAIRATPAGGKLEVQTMRAALGTYINQAKRFIPVNEDKMYRTLDRYHRYAQYKKKKARAEARKVRKATKRRRP